MTRTQLLGAVSAAALACVAQHAQAQSAPAGLYGGGSTLAEFDYFNEFSLYNSTSPSRPFSTDVGGTTLTFTTYLPAGSGAGQAGVITNDYTCLQNKITGNNGGNCAGTYGKAVNGDAVTVAYGASDATISSSQDAYVNGTQVGTWATATFGEQLAGDLIQIPSLGTGVSFPLVDTGAKPAITNGTGINGEAKLTDKDLCGIFSGQINTWAGVQNNGNLGTAAFNVTFRSDGSGTSFLLTNHLAAVCPQYGNTGPVTFAATTNFGSLFPTSPQGNYTVPFSISGVGTFYIPSWFVPQKGSQAVASYIAGVQGTVTSAIGYVSPDFTTIDPNSNAVLSNGAKSQLRVAAASNGTHYALPDNTSVELGLQNVATGQYLTGPTQATAHDPAQWVPLVQTVKDATKTVGPKTYYSYPVVGYTVFLIPQCFQDTQIPVNLDAFLNLHYTSSPTSKYYQSQKNNGFVAIPNVPAAGKLLSAIKLNILRHSTWNASIGDVTNCRGRAGR